MHKTRICVGAGKAQIHIDAALLPLDGYDDGATPLFVRAIVVDTRDGCSSATHPERTAIVSVEIPSIRDQELLTDYQQLVADVTDTPVDHVWICTTHNLTAPHIPARTADIIKCRAFSNRIKDAIRSAATEASELRNARFGWDTGICDANTSRDIKTNQGWWNGLHGESKEDKTLTVLRFDALDGTPIGIIWHYPIKSCAASDTAMRDGTRLYTGEVSGACGRYIEDKIGVPALFFMGSAADMVPVKCASYAIADENGDLQQVNEGEEAGLSYVAELGARLGEAAVSIADKVVPEELVTLYSDRQQYQYPGQRFYYMGHPYHPTPDYQYYPEDDEPLDINILQIGSSCLIGMAPETTATIGMQLRDKTAPVHVLLCSLVNGGKDYLADELAYDRCTFSGTHSVFARGGAEQFVADIAEYLHGMNA